MGGLMELGPMTETISVMGSNLTIRPISTEQLIGLLSKFPVLVELLGGQRSEQAIQVAGSIAIAHVIATATGEVDNPEAVERAAQLGVGKVAEILDKILEITFEDGVDPFMRRIEKTTRNTQILMGNSSEESSVPWSASLTGDAPRRTRLPLRRAS